MKNTIILLLSGLLCTTVLPAQPIDTEHLTYSNARTSLPLFKEFLAIPNDAHFPEDIEKNVVWCAEKLEQYGFTTKRMETSSVPLLLGTQREQIAGQPTVLFYIHIDGQPVDPGFWYQDNPYHAVLKEEREGEGWVVIDWDNLGVEALDPDWRIFARSSSDDKAPFIMLLTALRTLRNQGTPLPYNLKVILDMEEEIGSPNLAQAVLDNKEDLAADMLIVFDGPKHVSNQPTIAFGARGITTLSIKVYGPTFPLHSGHYGNYAPNPALRLAQLLSSMKDENGLVVIPGFYDGIELDQKTKEILAAVPDDEQPLMVKLGIGETDKVGANYQEALQYPSLNIRGMSSGWVGNEARTIVPSTALAEIDIRLVVESDGERLIGLVRKHIEDQGYHIVQEDPSSRDRFLHPKICRFSHRGITRAFRTDFDSGLGKWVFTVLKTTFGQDPIRLRTMGGTLPTSSFITTLNVPAVIIPFANSDNNQHSPNENLRLGNYFDGVKAMYALLTTPISKKD